MTRLLQEVRLGDPEALNRLMPMVHGELRRLAALHMRGERDEHTLTPTAVFHEVFLQLRDGAPIQAEDSAHFFRVASRMMRHVLVDHARARQARKRSSALRVTLDDEVAVAAPERGIDFLALDIALEELASAEPRWAEVVELRFFAGLEVNETAAAMGISAATVKRDWRFARRWLEERLSDESG
ncbi:MAG TPA: ECF-type sigma factor [Gemmatimonadales bacterium]|nr:ECF-type sigma factor [Gemmatimonadales bacterium]